MRRVAEALLADVAEWLAVLLPLAIALAVLGCLVTVAVLGWAELLDVLGGRR